MTFGSEPLMLEPAMAIAAIGIGLVFLYAGCSKLYGVSGFVAGVRGYEILPARFVTVIASLLIAGEALIGIAHVLNLALPLVVPAAIVLLVVFFVTVANLLRRGEKRPCLCFGAGRDDDVSYISLVRIGVLLAVEVRLLIYLRDEALPATSIEAYVVAALLVLIVGWFLALPNLYRAWRAVRS